MSSNIRSCKCGQAGCSSQIIAGWGYCSGHGGKVRHDREQLKTLVAQFMRVYERRNELNDLQVAGALLAVEAAIVEQVQNGNREVIGHFVKKYLDHSQQHGEERAEQFLATLHPTIASAIVNGIYDDLAA